MDRLRILYYSCHEILEYDDLRMLTSEGHSVFSLGDFSNPANRGHFRRSRPEFHQNGDWEAYVASDSQGPLNISRDFGARFDIAIVNHMPEWLDAAVRNLDCPIVYRSIGQSNPATEARIRAHEGRVKIVRYSNREAALEGFAATDKVIYFGKMAKDYTPGWEAGGARIVTFHHSYPNRSFASAPSLTDYQHLSDQFADFALYGAMNEGVSSSRGVVAPEDQADIYRSSAMCFYVPSVPPSYTLGLIEAMAFGLPVVAPSAKYMMSQVDQNHLIAAGFSQDRYEVPALLSDDPNALFDSLEEARLRIADLLDSPALSYHLSALNRESFAKTFDASNVAPQWSSYLLGLV